VIVAYRPRRLFGFSIAFKTEANWGGVLVSQAWQDPESAATAERAKSGGQVVAKVQVGGEWLVVTVPDQGDDDNESDSLSDVPDE
jgi:hypothetical protein